MPAETLCPTRFYSVWLTDKINEIDVYSLQDLYTNDESWEMKFAMRELPPVPDQRQYKYGEYNYY